MLDQLKELLDMQKALDEAILKERGIEKYPLEEMRIALFVELGELMQEFPSKFKFWKKNPFDNRDKALEEYADCLAFKMSIYNYEFEGKETYKTYLDEYDKCTSETSNLCRLMRIITKSILFGSLFELGNKLGFTWEEVYQAYKKKNKVNYERLKNGY